MPQEPEGHVIRETVRYPSQGAGSLDPPEPSSSVPAPAPVGVDEYIGRSVATNSTLSIEQEPEEQHQSPAPFRLSEAAQRSASGQQAQLDGGPQYKHQVRDVSLRGSALTSPAVLVVQEEQDEDEQEEDRHRDSTEFDLISSSRSQQEYEERENQFAADAEAADTQRATSASTVASNQTSSTFRTRSTQYSSSSPRSQENDRPVAMARARLLPDIEGQHSETHALEDGTEPRDYENSPSIKHTEHSSTLGNSETASSRKRQRKIVILAVIVLLLAAAVGAVLALVVFDKEEASEVFFSPVGVPLQGTSINLYLGTALALSQTGHRMAVASPAAVRIYEQQDSNGSGDKNWQRLGQDIVVAESGGVKQLDLQGHEIVAIAMDRAGENIVIGYGLASFETGQAQVFRYVQSTNEWIQVGQTLMGREVPGDRFGASVSMNADGDVIAVGAPQQEGAPGSVLVYQYDSNGQWGQRGLPILGDNSTSSVSQLGRSVSLSSSGHRVAAGARSTPSDTALSEFLNVVSVYEYELISNLEWAQLGKGINGISSTKTTGWYVELDATGNRMAVSNTYLNQDDFVNTDPNALVVQAFEFEDDSWVNFGDRLHGGIEDPESGYVISYSDSGVTMAMGDRGTIEGGCSHGHAYSFKYMDGKWMQHGPNGKFVSIQLTCIIAGYV